MHSASYEGPSARRSSPLFAGLLVAAFGAVGACASVMLAGTKTGLTLALGSIFGPICIYAALTVPLMFPFGLYVAAVPFDYAMTVTTFGTITRVVGAAGALALILYMVRARRAVRPAGVLFIWIGLCVWVATTAFWAIDDQTLFGLLPTFVQLVALYAVIAVYPAQRRDVRVVLGAVLAGGLVAAAWGVYLFKNGQDLVGNRLVFGAAQPGAAPTSSIDPNQFCAGLLLPIALALVGGLATRRRLPKVAFAAAFLVLLAGMAVAASRGAIVALAVMVVFVFIRSPWRRQLAAMLAPALVLPWLFRGALLARFSNATIATGSGRMDIWKVALTALKSHWLLGVGYDNFPNAYNQAIMETHTVGLVRWYTAPHDLVLGTLVELGVVGLALTLAGWYGQFAMLRVVEPKDEDYPLRLALEAAVIGLFVAALFLDMLVTKYLWLTFMVGALLYNAHHRRSTCAVDSSIMPHLISRRARSPASSSHYGTAG